MTLIYMGTGFKDMLKYYGYVKRNEINMLLGNHTLFTLPITQRGCSTVLSHITRISLWQDWLGFDLFEKTVQPGQAVRERMWGDVRIPSAALLKVMNGSRRR